MATSLGPHQYGKAENRVVRIVRDTPRHEIHDLNVSTSLRGDFEAAHTVGDDDRVDLLDAGRGVADVQTRGLGARHRSRGGGGFCGSAAVIT